AARRASSSALRRSNAAMRAAAAVHPGQFGLRGRSASMPLVLRRRRERVRRRRYSITTNVSPWESPGTALTAMYEPNGKASGRENITSNGIGIHSSKSYHTAHPIAAQNAQLPNENQPPRVGSPRNRRMG